MKTKEKIEERWLIYKHTLICDCAHKGWSYIGLTKQKVVDRWKAGKAYDNQLFGKVIKKYGWHNFKHEVLESDIKTLEEAQKRECYWIQVFHTYIGDPLCNGYNATLGGEGTYGYTWQEESKKKLSAAKSGIKHTPEYNAKLSLATGSGPVICIETGQVYYSLGDAKRCTKIRHIAECCHRKRKVAGGYHWAFVSDKELQEVYADFVGKERNITKYAKRPVRNIDTNEIFPSITAAEKVYKCCIPKVLSGERELAGGFHWEYVDDRD